MRGWLLIGTVLAVSGILLLLDGINQRFGGGSEASAIWDELLNVFTDTSLSDSANPYPDPTVNAATDADSTAGDAVPADSSAVADSSALTEDEKLNRRRDSRYKEMLINNLISAGWNHDEISDLKHYLDDPRAAFLPGVLEVNATHKETWEQYAHHLTPESMVMCRDFWDANSQDVINGAKDAKVPIEIIIAILKVETNFGRMPGTRSVFNVYWSLALADNPEVLDETLSTEDFKRVKRENKLSKRALWARSQLRDLIYMGGHHGEDPVGIIGSWAGAFGLSQFIPASYRAYGRDGNGDGVIDLDEITDAVASIAFYLESNGWKNNPNPKTARKVIKRYNHSEYYVDCVLALTDSCGTFCVTRENVQ